MIILAPEAKESAYMKAAEVFKEYYKKVTGISLEITNEIPENEDMVVIGSEAVQPFVYENLRGGLGIKFDSDEYRILSKEDKNRTILFLAGGRGRSTLYAVYDFFEKRGDCHYFWDGDVIAQKKSIDIKGLDIKESPRFTYRAIRYFAHRGLGRFQAEHWDFDEWKNEIDWICKSRLNMLMLRIGIDDLFQKAFPDIVSYPSNEEILPEAAEGYNNRTTFWSLEYRGQLQKRVMDYAFACDLMQPEDCGTMTHWYSRTPKEFLDAVKPGFLSQTSKSQSEQTGLVWDITDEKNFENYCRLTDTHIKEYGKPEIFHTIGLAERTYSEDRQKNIDLKKYVYGKITDYVSNTYPNAPLLVAAWDFFFALKPEEVRELTKLFNPEKHIIFDYTVDLKEEENNFEKWDIVGKLPWIFGIFHAYEPQNHIHGDYEYITKKLEIANQDPCCKGMAFWPETSHSDILMLEYFKENAWNPGKRTISEIAADMCKKRYGEDAVFMRSVWDAFLPLLKLPMKERMPSFIDILKTNAVFLRMFDFKDAYRTDCEQFWGGFEDYETGFEKYMKQIVNCIAVIPDEVLYKPFIRRDISDIMKTAVMLKLQYRFIKLSFSILRWYRGADEADKIKELLSYNEKMLSVFTDVLGMHEDNSMYDSLAALSKNRPINPHFEDALKDNVVNWYCRTGAYEASKGVYEKEFEFFKNWMLKQLSDDNRKSRNTDEFEKAKERIFEEFKNTPLKNFHNENKPSIKEIAKRFSDMLTA